MMVLYAPPRGFFYARRIAAVSSPAKSSKTGLTAAQERYCRERAKGLEQADAYRKANPRSTATRKTQGESASRMERLEPIRRRIAELQAQVDAGLIPTLEQIQGDLVKIASDESKPDGVRLKAYDQLTRMRGGYDDRVRVTGQVTLDGRFGQISDILPPPGQE